MSTLATLQAVGQPNRRLGNTFSYCSTGGDASRVRFARRRVRVHPPGRTRRPMAAIGYP